MHYRWTLCSINMPTASLFMAYFHDWENVCLWILKKDIFQIDVFTKYATIYLLSITLYTLDMFLKYIIDREIN